MTRRAPDYVVRPASLVAGHLLIPLGAAFTVGAHVAAMAVGAGLGAVGLFSLLERAYWLDESTLERRLSLRLVGLRLPLRRQRCERGEALQVEGEVIRTRHLARSPGVNTNQVSKIVVEREDRLIFREGAPWVLRRTEGADHQASVFVRRVVQTLEVEEADTRVRERSYRPKASG